MPHYNFTQMDLKDWGETRSAINKFAKVLGEFKKNFSQHNKNWEEHGLSFYAKGLTTGPVPVISENRLRAIDLNLNFYEHKMKIFRGEMRLSIPLEEQSIYSFTEEVITIINGLGINCSCDYNKFGDKTPLNYDEEKAKCFWNNLYQIYFILCRFKADLMEETGNVLFWPHHFDTSMLWFSGNIIDGKDPNNWSDSREQMNFGFSTGDTIVNEPYFYITSYPFNEKVKDSPLPGNAYWNKGDWTGAVLKYKDILDIDSPNKLVLDFFNTVLTNNKKLIEA